MDKCQWSWPTEYTYYTFNLRYALHVVRVLTKHYADALALILAYHRGQAERDRAEKTLQAVAHALSTTTGEEFFPNLVLTLSNALGVGYAFLGEIKPGQPDVIYTIAFCDHGRIVDNIDYHLAADTPCGKVECKTVCHFPDSANQLFPEDDLICRYGVETFIGHPLLGSGGRALGLLVVMHEKPAEKKHIQSLLQICASCAAAELERRRNDRVMDELARSVASVTGEAFFRNLVVTITKTLGVDYAFVGELEPRREQAIRTAAVCAHGKIIDNFTYDLHGTPCETVVGREFCAYPRNVQQQFPEDHALVEMGVESYMGAPLFDSVGRPIGILVALGHDEHRRERQGQTRDGFAPSDRGRAHALAPAGGPCARMPSSRVRLSNKAFTATSAELPDMASAATSGLMTKG